MGATTQREFYQIAAFTYGTRTRLNRRDPEVAGGNPLRRWREEVKKIEPVNANSVKVTVAVSADCRIGEHVAQLRTASGVSDYRNFFVGVLPEIEEVEPNSEFTAPQKIELGKRTCGGDANKKPLCCGLQQKTGKNK